MKKILIILLALIALSVLGWFGVYQFKAPDIQADIKQRVGDVLRSNSLDWVGYEVDGRDVTLNGVAANQQMAQHAYDTADIYGLNTLNSTITVGSAAAVGGSTDALPDTAQQTAGVVAEQDAVAVAQTSGAQAGDAAPSAAQDITVNEAAALPADTNASDIAPPATNDVANVAVQDVATDGIAALPITMNISRDGTGEYIFNGTVPDMAFKQTVDQHLVAVGADPAKAVWQVELSSATPPANWQPNILNTISAAQVLQDAEANLTADAAMIKGVAASQDASDAAEAFAQKIAGDFTTDMNFSIAEAPQGKEADAEEVSLVGSDQYAAKFCQTEFNALLKQQKIVFDSGSTNLQPASQALLVKVSQVAGRCPNHTIQVNGYTDSQGKAATNRRLSKVRAEAVVAYLAQKGIDKERLVAIGHGEKNPVASNKTEAGRAQNRRIKLIVKGLKK